MRSLRRASNTRVHDIIRRLEEAILSGDFQPGERLDEQKLAATFRASRTPVREALRHLSASGLVEVRPRKGATVAEISIPRMIQIFEVRSVIEGLCARLAARRMRADERDRLQAAHGEAGAALRACDLDHYTEINTVFHDLIYSGSHNPFLEDQARKLRNRVSAYRRHQLRQPDRMLRSFRQHEWIVAAILDGNGERADEMMRRHISMQGEDFLDFVSSLTAQDILPGD